jgi:hypothetical protein
LLRNQSTTIASRRVSRRATAESTMTDKELNLRAGLAAFSEEVRIRLR